MTTNKKAVSPKKSTQQNADVNGTSVKVTEVDQMTTIHITTGDADIYVNGQLIWQKYDDPLYANIPPALRPFVKNYASYLGFSERRKETEVDLGKTGFKTSATFYFPQKRSDFITVRLESFNSLDEYESEYIRNHTGIDDETADALVKEISDLWKDVENSVQDAGFRLAFSHSANDEWLGWWDVLFKLPDWNEEKFMQVWNKFSDVKKRLHELDEQYQF